MMAMVFWFSVGGILYSYFGYPLLLLLGRRWAARPVQKSTMVPAPRVSVVVVARNEENTIGQRLTNLMHQQYPPDLLEIIVVSDGSTDQTMAEAERMLARCGTTQVSCRLIDQLSPQGKPAGLNAGVAVAGGEILVFCDCRQTFADSAIAELVANFSDPSVGAVSGELLFHADDDRGLVVEMGAYWQFEKKIRKLESATGSVMGATGAIYAIRKSLFVPLSPATILDDVIIPLQVIQAGYRVVFDEDALAYDRVSAEVGQEWRRKVRTLTGNWQILSLYPEVFNPRRAGLCFRFLSHKISRLLVPYGLVAMLVSSALAPGPVYLMLLWGQILFYGIAVVACAIKSFQKIRLIKLISFFCLLNLAAGWSLWLWLFGRSASVWKPKTWKTKT